jgi:hypothetical protein
MGCRRDSRINDSSKAGYLCPLLTPAIDLTASEKIAAKTDQCISVEGIKSSNGNRKTPAEWCEKFGVRVIDPDGWDRTNPKCMSYPITQDMFIDRFQRSTAGVVDREKYKVYQHLFQ